MKNQSQGRTLTAGRSRLGSPVTRLDACLPPWTSFICEYGSTGATAWKSLVTGLSSDSSGIRVWMTPPSKPPGPADVLAGWGRVGNDSRREKCISYSSESSWEWQGPHTGPPTFPFEVSGTGTPGELLSGVVQMNGLTWQVGWTGQTLPSARPCPRARDIRGFSGLATRPYLTCLTL